MKVILVTGEVSGDILGAQLMRSLKQNWTGPLIFKGVGGESMKKEGLSSLFSMSELSIIGIKGILKNLFSLLRRIRQTADFIIKEKPDIIIMIDNPAFTHRVAKRVRRYRPEVPMVNYVSPTVWAWGRHRMRAMEYCFDGILSIFPFEPAFFAQHSTLSSTYVGHPSLALLETSFLSFFKMYHIPPQKKLFLILPGSRPSEVKTLMPLFCQALSLLQPFLSSFIFVLPTVTRVRQLVEEQSRTWPEFLRPLILEEESEKYAAMKEASLALAASGTVTLELGLCGVPTVVACRLPAWEAFLMRRFIEEKDPFLSIPNIVLKKEIMAECVQENCTAEKLAEKVKDMLEVSNFHTVREGLAEFSSAMLDSLGPSVERENYIGKLVLDIWERKKSL